MADRQPTNTYDFTGRVGLVTGGGRGIGRAAAERLSAGGAQVAILDRDGALAAATATEIGALAITADVTRSDEVSAAVARVESELGRLDVLVCSAGIGGESLHTEEVSDAEWEQVFAVNCHGENSYWESGEDRRHCSTATCGRSIFSSS